MTKPPRRLSLLGNRVSVASPRISARPKQSDRCYSTPEHRAWRLAVCRAAGSQCEAIEDGRRCEKSARNGDRLFADHITERRDGGADDGPWSLSVRGSPHREDTERTHQEAR